MADRIASPIAFVERLSKSTNDHDLEAVVACFATDYRNETPLHPERGFTGREQVRKNWTSIFAGVPDVTVEVIRVVSDEDVVWSEWEHRGTKTDGSLHLMKGVVIFGVVDGQAGWARFYLEPVDEHGENADEFLDRQLRMNS
ncbi:MAG: nuclear transport factor 2 family protein [Acidimicrobiia bacterium]